MTEAEYSDAGLGLNMGGKMMDLDLNRSILNVNYSDRLILLIREVRQLAELGLKGKVSQ
jgi:dynein heavy chain 2